MTEGGDEFVIDSIITFSRTRNRFFLSWQGYPPSDNTWEPYSSFSDKDTPSKFLKKLQSLGVVCEACVGFAKSSSTVTPDKRCKCAQRSPSPICTPGKRALDMMKQADAKVSPTEVLPDPGTSFSSHGISDPSSKQKRSRSASSLESSSSTPPVAKVPRKSMSEMPAHRPSQPASDLTTAISPGASAHSADKMRPKESLTQKKTSPLISTKMTRPIPFQQGLSSSDDDERPLQKQPTAPSSASRDGAIGFLAQGGAAARVPSAVASSPRTDSRVDIDDPDVDEPQPDASSPRERRVLMASQFTTTSSQQDRLLRGLANPAAPTQLTQEQKDALSHFNWQDIRDMGIWKQKDVLDIMKKLPQQVGDAEIKNFFVRLPRKNTLKFSHGSWSPFEQDVAFVLGVKERHRTVDAKNQLELCVAGLDFTIVVPVEELLSGLPSEMIFRDNNPSGVLRLLKQGHYHAVFDAAASFSLDFAQKKKLEIGVWSRKLTDIREQVQSKSVSAYDYKPNSSAVSSQPVINATEQWNLQPSTQVSRPMNSFYTPSVPNLPPNRPPVPLFNQSPDVSKPSYEPMGSTHGSSPHPRPNPASPTPGSNFGSNSFGGSASSAAAPAPAGGGGSGAGWGSSNAGTAGASGGGGGGWGKSSTSSSPAGWGAAKTSTPAPPPEPSYSESNSGFGSNSFGGSASSAAAPAPAGGGGSGAGWGGSNAGTAGASGGGGGGWGKSSTSSSPASWGAATTSTPAPPPEPSVSESNSGFGSNSYDAGTSSYTAPPFRSRPGDWNCPQCKKTIFGSKNLDACDRCQTPKPEGAGNSEGNPPSFAPRPMRAGDWNCTKCKKMIFGSKNLDACDKCNEPKPEGAGFVGSGGGYGGGNSAGRKRESIEGSVKLFVGNIPKEDCVQELRETFAQFGTVCDAFCPRDKETSAFRGFGFLTLADEAAANAAIEAATAGNLEFRGRNITVKLAGERPPPAQSNSSADVPYSFSNFASRNDSDRSDGGSRNSSFTASSQAAEPSSSVWGNSASSAPAPATSGWGGKSSASTPASSGGGGGWGAKVPAISSSGGGWASKTQTSASVPERDTAVSDAESLLNSISNSASAGTVSAPAGGGGSGAGWGGSNAGTAGASGGGGGGWGKSSTSSSPAGWGAAKTSTPASPPEPSVSESNSGFGSNSFGGSASSAAAPAPAGGGGSGAGWGGSNAGTAGAAGGGGGGWGKSSTSSSPAGWGAAKTSAPAPPPPSTESQSGSAGRGRGRTQPAWQIQDGTAPPPPAPYNAAPPPTPSHAPPPPPPTHAPPPPVASNGNSSAGSGWNSKPSTSGPGWGPKK